MAAAQSAAEWALEKELTCSICTEIIFQPLALIECLHTFCGSCLKEWFLHQASTAQTVHPYTCPSCRATVKSTQRHAMMTSLLEQFLQAHPEKDRTAQEKEAVMRTYKPGEQVLPKLRRRRRPEDEHERRLMDDVRQLSMQDVAHQQQGEGLQPPSEGRHHRSSRSRSGERDEDRHRTHRHRHARSRESSSSGVESRARPPRITPSTVAGPPTAHQVAHQASLRSLLNAPGIEPGGLEQAIVDRLVAQNLLEGFDLDNLEAGQEEEVQARILTVFRQISEEHRNGGRQAAAVPPLAGTNRSSTTTTTSPAATATATAVTSTASTQAQPETQTPHHPVRSEPIESIHSRPPVSRPHLFDIVNDPPRTHRRRTSSQGSSRSAMRAGQEQLSATGTSRGPSRSASDLLLDETQLSGSSERPRRASASTRRTTDPEGHPRLPNVERAARVLPERRTSSNPTSPAPTQTQFAMLDTRQQHATFPITPRDTPPAQKHITRPPPIPTGSSSSAPTSASVITSPRRNQFLTNQQRRPVFVEPIVTCDRCQREHIEYLRHYYCQKCPSTISVNLNYSLCLSCYRHEKGCNHWFGFTKEVAVTNHSIASASLSPQRKTEEPHMLHGRRWRKPQQPMTKSTSDSNRSVTEEDPAQRQEIGVFCDTCGAFTNSCYWKCDTCNDGAWGFCNDCTNTSKHCTHPLIPLSHKPTADRSKTVNDGDRATFEIQNDSDTSASGPFAPLDPLYTPKSASSLGGAQQVVIAELPFVPQSFTTECDVCHFPIQPTMSRYHCPECNRGDYDICMPCYGTLVSSGRIRREDGPSGWRRCPKAHRMSIIGFEDRESVQWRVVVQDRVGGSAFKEEGVQWNWIEDDGSLRHVRSRNPSRSPRIAPIPTVKAANAAAPTNALTSATGGLLGPADQQQRKDKQHQLQQRVPPSGGVGLIIRINFPWWPAEGARDELMFPKGAEIREAENINEDWFWGCYAGAKGLFPGGHGRIVGVVE